MPTNKDLPEGVEIPTNIPDNQKNFLQKAVELLVPYNKKKLPKFGPLENKIIPKNNNVNNDLNNNVNNMSNIPDEEEEVVEMMYYTDSLPKSGPLENIIIPKNTGTDPYSIFREKNKMI